MAMRHEVLEIANLVGLDRNKATGDDPDQGFVPDEVYNLVPTKRGAWTPLGKTTDLPGALTLPADYIGFDQGGLASFEDGSNYKIFDGDAIATSEAGTVSGADTEGIESASGLSGFSGQQQIGYRFTPTQAVTVKSIRVVGYHTGTETVRLWDVDTQTAIFTEEVAVDGSGSWFEQAITPVTLEAGKSYIISTVVIPQASRILLSATLSLISSLTFENGILHDGIDYPATTMVDGGYFVDIIVEGQPAKYSDLTGASHIPKFGTYKSRTQFFGRDNSNPRVYVEPFDITPTVTPHSTEGSDEITVDCNGENIVSVAYAEAVGTDGGNRFVVVTTVGHIWSGPALDNLEQRQDASPAGFNKVRWCNDRFVALTDAADIYYSTDGETWTFVDATEWELRDVIYDPLRDAIIAVGDVVIRSTDGAVTWTQVDDAQVSIPENMRLTAVSIDDTGFMVAVSDISETFLGDWAMITSPDGVTWTNRIGAKGVSMAFSSGVWVAVFGSRVITSPDGLNWVTVTNNLTNGETLRAVAANDELFVAVGDNNKVHQSANGIDWTEIPSPGVNNWKDVTIAGDGTVIIVGDNGKAFMVNATSGLRPGTYTVYWTTTVSTDAGLLVVSLGSERHVLAGEAGNTIDVTIPDTATILAGAPSWMTQEFLEGNVFVDIYVASTVGLTGDEESEGDVDPLANTSPVFDFTLRPGGTLTETIDSIPIGRILGGGQGVMTVAFDDPDTVLHGERVWGLFSGNESLYTKGDDAVEVEVSRLAGSFAVGYTDIGYVNLARQGNYIPLAPGESEAFTGMVSTPSGLLVFFTNEVFLIAGDPALDSLTAELYPAIVGADVGTRPTKLGGVAFSIWKGKVYALSGGQAQHISRPADDRDDPFIELTPEPETTSLLARTASGVVYRFMVEDSFWLLNTITDADYILPHPDALGSRYRAIDGSIDYVATDIAADVEPDTPYVIYREFDYGTKNQAEATYKVDVPITNYFVTATPPRLFFKILENNDEIDDPESTSFVTGRLYERTYRFTLPRKHRSRSSDFKFEFRGMLMASTIEPQIEFHYIPGATHSRRSYNPDGSVGSDGIFFPPLENPVWPTTYGSGTPYSYKMAGDWGQDTVDGQTLTRTILFDPATWTGTRALSQKGEEEGGSYVQYSNYFVALDYMIALDFDGNVVWEFDKDNANLVISYALAGPNYIYVLAVETTIDFYKVIVVDPATGARIAESPEWESGNVPSLQLTGDETVVLIPCANANTSAFAPGRAVKFNFDTGVHQVFDLGLDNTTGGDFDAYAVSADGLHYYNSGSDDTASLVDPVYIRKFDNDHNLIWQSVRPMAGFVCGMMELADGNLLVVDGTDPGPTFVKLDGATGLELDSVADVISDFPRVESEAGPLLSNGVIAMPSRANTYLHFFDTINWAIVKAVNTNEGFSNAPKGTPNDVVWYRHRPTGAGLLTLAAYDSSGNLLKTIGSAEASLEFIDFRLPYSGGVVGYSTAVNAICKWEF